MCLMFSHLLNDSYSAVVLQWAKDSKQVEYSKGPVTVA